MESKTKNRKTRAQIASMVERTFPGLTLATGEDAMSELKEGWFNAAYDVRLSYPIHKMCDVANNFL